MTSKAPSSRKIPGPRTRREAQEAVIEDAPETGDRDRDLVHGEGGSIGIPTQRRDLSQGRLDRDGSGADGGHARRSRIPGRPMGGGPAGT
jgi:hypothetical protein